MELVWDTHAIYESDEAWKDGRDDLISDICEFENKVNFLLDDLDFFLAITKLKILIDEKIERVYVYPRRILDLNINDEEHKKMFAEALDIYDRILKNTAIYERLVVDNKSKVLEYLNDNDAAFYQRYYEIIFAKGEHISDNDSSFNTYQIIRNEYQELLSKLEFSEIMIDGETKVVNNETFSTLLQNADEDIRRQVYETLTESYLSIGNQIADLFVRKLRNDLDASKTLGYKSLKEMKLSKLELPDYLIDRTIEWTHDNLNIMHEYVNLKKELSELSEYHLYDSAIPVSEEKKTSISFEDALDIVKESLKVLGDEYVGHIDKLVNQGSIDAYPKDTKRKLDFTGITYAGIPYMCLNFTGKRSNIRTLAHEFGHAINLMYSKENNDFTYFEFSLFLTEIVAKVNECIINEYFINNDHDGSDLAAVVQALSNSLFNQVMFTEFEDKVISKLEREEKVDLEVISAIYEEVLTKYNGSSLTKHKYDKYAWLRINHFVMQESYYLYQYSIGTALANIIYYKIKNEDNFKDKYLEFLGIGNRMNIIDSLKFLGIDLLDKSIFDSAFDNLNNYVKKLQV